MRVNISFSLNSDKDRDLVRWLDSLPKRAKSQAIRDTLRAGLGRGSVTLGDVYQAVKDLDRKLGNGALMAVPGDQAGSDEPADVAATLDSLGL